jgi:ribosomal protein L16
MMQPKRTKFRKQFKGKISGSAQRGNTVAFGEFGLKATDRCRMTAREIEAARRAISRYVKRGGRSKCAWVQAKATSSIGWRECCPARCCSRSKA